MDVVLLAEADLTNYKRVNLKGAIPLCMFNYLLY